MMETKLTSSHQKTYDSIFQHPIARNLQWREVRSMLDALTDSTEEGTEKIKFTRNGVTLIVHPPKHKDFSDINELMQIRHFLEKSVAKPETAAAEGTHLLVVIDHREARIFKTELHGTTPQKITPFDPTGANRHLRNVEEDGNGQRKPEPKAFYEAIAKSLVKAEKILLFGSATGSSSAMEHLLADLKDHHPDIAKRVIDSVVIDEQHMTEDQLLAKAREIYGTKPA